MVLEPKHMVILDLELVLQVVKVIQIHQVQLQDHLDQVMLEVFSILIKVEMVVLEVVVMVQANLIQEV